MQNARCGEKATCTRFSARSARTNWGGQGVCVTGGDDISEMTCGHLSFQARLAQPAERKALNLVVVGSSPTVGVLAPTNHAMRLLSKSTP